MWVSVLYSRTLLFTHPVYNSLHLKEPVLHDVFTSGSRLT